MSDPHDDQRPPRRPPRRHAHWDPEVIRAATTPSTGAPAPDLDTDTDTDTDTSGEKSPPATPPVPAEPERPPRCDENPPAA